MPLPRSVEADYPGLAAGYEETSDATPLYNCIGHALGDSETWWEPAQGCYWATSYPT
jgi:hypothetical protein